MISLVYIKIFHYINVSIGWVILSKFLTYLFCFHHLEKADKQQPKQQETEANQYNPLLHITDLFPEVNKVCE